MNTSERIPMRHISIHVYDDGDTELTAIDASPGHVFTTNDIVYAPTEISKGSLDKELISYGHEPDAARKAIDYILHAQPGTTVIVGKV